MPQSAAAVESLGEMRINSAYIQKALLSKEMRKLDSKTVDVHVLVVVDVNGC